MDQIDTSTDGQAAAMDRTEAGAAPTEAVSTKPQAHPVSRFAAAVKSVLSFGSYPLSGKVANELHEATEELSKHFEGGAAAQPSGSTPLNVDDAIARLAAKRDELVASAKAEIGDHLNTLKGQANADLNGALDQVKSLIKAAGDEQVALVKAAPAAKAS